LPPGFGSLLKCPQPLNPPTEIIRNPNHERKRETNAPITKSYTSLASARPAGVFHEAGT
jgi:hypothetical protein